MVGANEKTALLLAQLLEKDKITKIGDRRSARYCSK